MDVVAKILVLQLFVAAVVVFVLKKMLEKDLLLTALERASGFHPDAAALKAERIVVVSAGKLAPGYRARLVAALKGRCPGVCVDFLENADLKGGIVVEIGGEIWDHSLATRLKHLFGQV